jgi:hypothetical protein
MTTYLGSGDKKRQRTDYRPQWLSSLADDVTSEASAVLGMQKVGRGRTVSRVLSK